MNELDAALRARYGEPAVLPWQGEISDAEWGVATYNPIRFHDVTLFILDPQERLALIRKPPFAPDVWRPPGGGVKPGEDPTDAAVREALEETGLHVRLERYLVVTDAAFRNAGRILAWQTHVLLARTDDTELEPNDLWVGNIGGEAAEVRPGDPAAYGGGGEIEAARWGTLEELAGPLREILLATGRAFWRYRVALHDAALAALRPL